VPPSSSTRCDPVGGLAFILTVELTVEAVTEVTPELEQALAVLMPQLNPALIGPTKEELIALLADPATTLLVAREEAGIVATATVIVYTTPAWVKARIEDVVVDEAARGHGVGEALVNECLSVARKRGARVIELQSSRRREVANRLYPRLGFERRESNVYRKTLG
jgi:ribosomal protein S18 acetylase RimI-like enzyme